jgi:hypothetical protein
MVAPSCVVFPTCVANCPFTSGCPKKVIVTDSTAGVAVGLGVGDAEGADITEGEGDAAAV